LLSIFLLVAVSIKYRTALRLVAYSIEIIIVHMCVTDCIQNTTVLMLVAHSVGHRTVLRFCADCVVKHQLPIFSQAARVTYVINLQLKLMLTV